MEATMVALYKDQPLETRLLEFGEKLEDFPYYSYDELLSLLDELEICLSMVEQSPSESMRNALSPSLEALIADELLDHSDDDEFRVAVASCFSEIIRITAPDPPPYDDSVMEGVFNLIVSSFENMGDKGSQSYRKRTSILVTMATVRSYFLMLDLQFYATEDMFSYFLGGIRDYHPESFFSSMLEIMTGYILEEENEYFLRNRILDLILDSLRNDNNKVLPIARKLGERVLENCAAKVKPHLLWVVEDKLETSIDDYSKVVATICRDADSDVEKTEVQDSDENMATLCSNTLVDSPGQMAVDSPGLPGMSSEVQAKKRKGTSSGVSRGTQHPLWNYGSRIEDKPNGVKCNFCGSEIRSGGITRFVSHLLPDYPDKNVKKCTIIKPHEVDEVKNELEKWKREKGEKKTKRQTMIEVELQAKQASQSWDSLGFCLQTL